jgi:hypothetical protein
MGEFIGQDDVIDVALTDALHKARRMSVLHLTEDGWHYQRIPASAELFTAFKGLIAYATWMAANPELAPLVDLDQSGGIRWWRSHDHDLTCGRTPTRRHGLGKSGVDALLANQGGSCAICGVPYETTPAGWPGPRPSALPGPKGCPQCVRGMTCNRCNNLLRLAGDDPTLLLKAIAYP